MKNKVLIFLTALFCISFLFSLSSCQKNEDDDLYIPTESSHTCSFDVVEFDENEHWYKCVCGMTKMVKFEHEMFSNCQTPATCKVCSYTIGGLGLHTFEKDECVDCGKTASVGLEYKLSEDGFSYLVVGIGECKDTELIIPSMYNNLPVTEIDSRAFYENEQITRLVISDSVVIVDAFAFYGCKNLTRVVIGTRVGYIWDSAFDDCYKLVEVISRSPNIELSNLYAGNGFVDYFAIAMFDYNEVYVNRFTNDNGYVIYNNKDKKVLVRYEGESTDLVVPDYVTSIHRVSFINHDNITSVKISDSVTYVGNFAFWSCNGMLSVKIGNGITEIDDHAFGACGFSYVILGNNVTKIGMSAFGYCDNLESVYYCGTKEQWQNIIFKSNNDNLINATIYYYIENQTDVPTDGGNYWHYDGNGNPVVW